MGSRYRLAYGLLAALAVLVLAAEIALVVRGRDEDERLGMVLDAVGRQSCAADEHAAGYPHAAVNAYIECGHTGPGVRYARFTSGLQMQDDLLADAPRASVCVADREVLVDYLEGSGEFAPLCRRFDGRIVNGRREGLRRFWHR
ncbi:hypothetical protein C8N24_1831 [Solirubrobacter pauli]|uniref:Uncharacterized protein n=1 Tax=Solirubrobacter pauli TaxID=166793 RepID=A0A660LAF6_9ACTN|nr:hypothetical protein [Solirubrobacter pauli]RKQ91992.1 hypothetical protein C8N24_1831 [Solirubrobacter pauli]